jgi:hypothetical protein
MDPRERPKFMAGGGAGKEAAAHADAPVDTPAVDGDPGVGEGRCQANTWA